MGKKRISLRKRNLKACRKWYRKNREVKKRAVAKQRTREYKKWWYTQHQAWIKAKKALRDALRPDLVASETWRTLFPLLKVKTVECENAKELQKHYLAKLRELRVLFGRDPDTGRLKKKGPTCQ